LALNIDLQFDLHFPYTKENQPEAGQSLNLILID